MIRQENGIEHSAACFTTLSVTVTHAHDGLCFHIIDQIDENIRWHDGVEPDLKREQVAPVVDLLLTTLLPS